MTIPSPGGVGDREGTGVTSSASRVPDGEPVPVLGALHRIRLRHTDYTVIETVAAPGSGLPPHSLDAQDQAIYVLEGEFLLTTSDEQRTLEPGSVAVVARGSVHSLTAAGVAAARCLVILTPPGGAMEAFLDELRIDGTGRSGDAATVYATARRVGIPLLTSPV